MKHPFKAVVVATHMDHYPKSRRTNIRLLILILILIALIAYTASSRAPTITVRIVATKAK